MADQGSSADWRTIISFFILTFGIAWGIWIPVGLFAPDYFTVGTLLLGVWAPSLSALLLTRLREGNSGLRHFVSRIFKWRVGLQWWLVVLFSTAAIAYAAIGLNALLGGSTPPVGAGLPESMRQDLWLYVVPIFILSIFAGGPLAEDIGWRGYILPKLREGMSAFAASLVIGVIWVIWHLPFFIFPEGASIVAYLPLFWFALITTAWSVLMAWVYVNTQSILMPVLFHAAINTTLGALGLLGGAQGFGWPLYLYTALTWIAVGIVVWVFGTDLVRKPEAAAQAQLAPA